MTRRQLVVVVVGLLAQSCGYQCPEAEFDLRAGAHPGQFSTGACRQLELEPGVVWAAVIESGEDLDSLYMHLTVGDEIWAVELEAVEE